MNEDSIEEVNKELNRIYHELLENSEPLDPEFAQILHDNLWDLYVRTEDA